MTPQETKEAVAYGQEMGHRREYEEALRVSGRTSPAWSDLTEGQREKIREENRRYWREMHEFGASLRAMKID